MLDQSMAGIPGKSGPPGNQNAFRHGLAGIAQRRAEGVLNPAQQAIREEILSGLLADKGGASQISTAMRVLAEIIASDVSLLVTFNHAIDGVIENNPKARGNPKALAQLDGYKRPLVSSLSGNLERFGREKVNIDLPQRGSTFTIDPKDTGAVNLSKGEKSQLFGLYRFLSIDREYGSRAVHLIRQGLHGSVCCSNQDLEAW